MRTICKCGSVAIYDDPEHDRCDVCWRDDEIERLKQLCEKYRAFVVEQECECFDGRGELPSRECDRCRLLRSEP